jgi:hypothetical protein
VETAQSDDSVWTYAAAGALLAGAAAVYRGQQQQSTGVAEPDLEAANNAMRVAMLFGGGKSTGTKAPARGKAAPKKAAPKKAPARKLRPGLVGAKATRAKSAAPPPGAVASDDIFVHEGTNGFTGDEFPWVYRQGLQ